MSVVHLIDTITEWARHEICDKVKLKQPPGDLEAPVDAAYDYKLVNPAVFPMYVPTAEKLPPNVHAPFPSLCVRFTAGQDELGSREGSVDIELCFAAWDTGTHGKDILVPANGEGFRVWSGEEAEAYFKRNGDGWRDAWNFVDTALRAVESVTTIGGYTIDHSVPVKFGPLTEQESIPDLYPFWFAWVSFRVNYPLMRNIEDFKNYL